MISPQIVARFEGFPPHPLSCHSLDEAKGKWVFPKGGFNGMKNGDLVQFVNGRPVRLDEVLQNGDALVTLSDGGHAMLNSTSLQPWPEERPNRSDPKVESAIAAILDAGRLVEALPADVRLTDAVVLLSRAALCVQDYVEDRKQFRHSPQYRPWED